MDNWVCYRGIHALPMHTSRTRPRPGMLGSPQPYRNPGTHSSICYPSIYPPPSTHLSTCSPSYPHLPACPWYEKSVVEKMVMRLLSGAIRCTQRRWLALGLGLGLEG